MARTRSTETLKERLARNSEVKDEHILWTGAKDTWGYGQLIWYDKLWRAHRLAYVCYNGPIPDGMLIMHTCDIPACINPKHLKLGTQQENTADKIRKGRFYKNTLDENSVRHIRSSTESNYSLAKKYSVNESTITRIKHGVTWKHVT